MPDGRLLLYFLNHFPNEIEEVRESDPDYLNEAINNRAIDVELVRLGVLRVPEVPATDVYGHENPFVIPLYRDSRIGEYSLHQAYEWIGQLANTPPEIPGTQRRFSGAEVKVLVSMALDEMKISDVMQQIHRTAAAQPMDLDSLLQDSKKPL